MKNKILGILVVLMMVFTITTTVKAVTIDDLMTQIKVLQKQIADLKVLVKAEVLDAVESITKTTTPAKSTVTVPVKTIVPTTTKTTLTPTSSTTGDDNASNTLPLGDSKTTVPVTTQTPTSKKATNTNSSGWENVGIPGFSLSSGKVFFALDLSNVPFIAINEYLPSTIGNTNRLSVMKWDGTSWVYVGNPGISNGDIQDIFLSFDLNNTPFISFRNNLTYKIIVLKYNSSAWINVGSSDGISPGSSDTSSMSFGLNNVPYIAYRDGNYQNKVSVMKWNGSAWVYVGNPGISEYGSYPKGVIVKISSNGIPYVGYNEEIVPDNDFRIEAKKYDGSSWVNIGSPINITSSYLNNYLDLDFSLDSNNVPYFAYRGIDDSSNFSRAVVKKLKNSSWADVCNPYFSDNYPISLSIDFDSNNIPYVAYGGIVTVVKKCDGTNWTNVGGPGFSAGFSSDNRLNISTNNILYVGYKDFANSNKATVMKYVTPPPPSSLTITQPNGGEIFSIGQQFTANWSSTGFSSSSPMTFRLVNSNSPSIYYILTSQTNNDGTETFTIPLNVKPDPYKLYGKFLNTTTEDYSDNSFMINGPSLNITSPNGGESFYSGQQFTVTWTTPGYSSSEYLSFDLKQQGGSNVTYQLATNTPNDGTEIFTIPLNTYLPPGQYKLYGKLVGKNVSDYSDNSFAITSWVNIGNAGFSGGSTNSLSFAINSNNVQYVAFGDHSKNDKATVMKWNGSTWTNVGTPGFSANTVNYIKLAFGSDDVPYVAFMDGVNNKVTVMKWNGSTWTNVGNAGFSASTADDISLAIDSYGTPYVSYRDFGYSKKVTVKKFDGAAWVNVGNAGFSIDEGDFTSLAIGSSNVPYVAYKDFGNGQKVTVMKWNGSAWVNAGNVGFSPIGANWISLVFAPNGTPFVSFAAYADAYKARVMKLNGSTWENVGSSTFSAGTVSDITLAVNSSNIPYVTYSDGFNVGKIIVKKFDGSSWTTVGNPYFSIGAASSTLISFTSDDIPYVGFEDIYRSGKATVMKYQY